MDFGCGCGRVARALPKYLPGEVFGCDITADAIEWCQQNLPGTYLMSAELGGAEARAAIERVGIRGDVVVLDVSARITANGAAKPAEFAAVIAGQDNVAPPHRAVRLALFGIGADDVRFSPLEHARRIPPATVASASGV